LSAAAEPAAALSAPATRRARPSFAGAVRSELLKVGRQGLTWTMLAGFILLCMIAFGSVVASGDIKNLLQRNPTSFYFNYLGAVEQVFTIASGVFLLIASSRLVSLEYGTGTIRVVLARGTGRLELLAAQYAALGIAGLLLLAGFAAVAAGFLSALVIAWHGSLAPVASLPQVAWHDTWLNLLVALASMAVCILLGTAAAAIGRSVAFGVGAALAFFPADNFGTIVMGLLVRITHHDFWAQATQYFLGPTLNQLPASLQTDHAVGAAFATPLVQHVDAVHCWAVIAVYAFLFLAASVVLTWRRDILH
jgi:ABC-type transport system involved in multi-copper enzyme maturation permease subunit